jgi:hypothetical protein
MSIHQQFEPSNRLPQSTIEEFGDRCFAWAILVITGLSDLQDTVDELQQDAFIEGLVHGCGQDAVQAVMAREFDRAAQTMGVT